MAWNGDMTSDAVPAFVRAGARVSWDTWCGVAHVTVTGVTPYRVFYVSDDGVGGFWEASCFHGLAYSLRNLRPSPGAVAAERAEDEVRARARGLEVAYS